jgi:type IV pilus assembly protein PilC
MSKYFYIARNKAGQKVSGIEDATTEEELVSRIQARDLIVISVNPDYKEGGANLRANPLASRSKVKHQHARIGGSDLVLFCRQLATLLGAGVTILKSLDIIAQQVSSRRLYAVIRDLQRNMEKGLSFHEAMARHPSVFSDLWVNLVESGEASGNLAVVLNRLAAYFERIAAFKRKIISSLIYPIILLFASVGALLFMTIKIIPAFAEIFKGMNIKLPVLTQILIAVSVFLREKFFIVLGVIVVVIYLVRRYINSKDGRLKYEKLKFDMPLFGEFFHAITVERFSSEMATLLESGVPILYSLEITEHSVGNPAMAEIVRGIKDDIRDGKPLVEPFGKCGFFEPMVVQMVGIGEEIGELSQMFKKINIFYQDYTETFLNRIIAMFEPLILVFMGILIGIMVVGMFMPIFQITQIGT